MRRLTLAVPAVLNLTACTSAPASRVSSEAPSPSSLVRPVSIEGTWVPSELHGVQVSNLRGRENGGVDVEFDGDGSWSAYDGCNRATGNYTADSSGAFTATNYFRTTRACPAPVLGGDLAVAAVASARRVQVDGSTLTLWGDGSNPTARLTRAPN